MKVLGEFSAFDHFRDNYINNHNRQKLRLISFLSFILIDFFFLTRF